MSFLPILAAWTTPLNFLRKTWVSLCLLYIPSDEKKIKRINFTCLIDADNSHRLRIHAFLYLLGEDRWMCTLMIQKGWRLTYCAAAEDSTYCPESFDEFYKQRRRWTPSTLANLVLLVSEWKRILRNNEHISFLFILYQTFLVCSTVIG